MSVILGIDPGSQFTGWGFIRNESECLGSGVIVLAQNKPFHERLGILQQEMALLMQKFKPKAVAVEKVFLAKNVDSAFKLGHARGVILAQAGLHHVPMFEYATRYVKKVLTGNGGASKEQVQFWVQKLLNVTETSLDATDALALAICHAREAEVWQRFGVQSSRKGRAPETDTQL